MSSTRRAEVNADLSQERWCSAPEFNHSLNAIAVAKRAQLVSDEKLRALIWFLQWRSLRPNGLLTVARDLLSQYRDRIGTPAMHRFGCDDPQRVYTAEQVREIRDEFPEFQPFPLRGEADQTEYWADDDRRPAPSRKFPESYTVADVVEEIPAGEQTLTEHLKRMCLDPKMSLDRSACANTAELWWFQDFTEALWDYREHACQAAAADLANTDISALIIETLGFCLRQRRMVLLEGNPGLGKSITIRAWVEMQGGLARYFEVPSSGDDRSFFAKMADVIGVANGPSYNGQQIKLRVETALQTSGLMLVPDEAQFAWPQYMRPRGTPARMQWIKTAFDAGTPIALAGFKFTEWRALYVAKTNWADEQFERRLNRTIALPAAHSEADLRKIAEKLLPLSDEASFDFMMAMARMNPKKGASAMAELVTTARDISEQEGVAISYDVLERAAAINHPTLLQAAPAEVCAPSRSKRDTTAIAKPLQGSRKAPAQKLFESAIEPDRARRSAGRNPATESVPPRLAAMAIP